MEKMTVDYTVAGLSLQKAALVDQLRRVPKSDAFASMLLMGKIKAVQRQLDALPSLPEKQDEQA
jgi:hypothetical protein